MRGFGLQRQRPVADQLRIAAVLLRKIGRWMPQYAMILPAICYAQRGGMAYLEIIIIVKNIGRAIVRRVLRCWGKEAEG